MPYLFVNTDEPEPSKVEIPESGHLTIGRSGECVLTLDDASVSGKHCYVEKVEDQYWLIDMKSTNGTRVNGKRIERCALKSGDIIRMGEARLVFGERDMAGKVRMTPAKLVGRKIGQYEITEVLGETKTGTNLLAVQPVMRRKVVVKVLPPLMAMHDKVAGRFRRQARVGGLLGHPNIAAAYDAGEYEGFQYLITEYVTGESLKSVLAREQKLSPAKSVDYGIQMAKALAYLEGEGVIHRNLKPGNIFVQSNGYLKLVDMWLAKDVGSDTATRLTVDGQMLGTVAYMAPEQIRDPANVDHRADVYALGVILFEMVCGRRPFVGKTKEDVVDAIQHAPSPDPKTIGPKLPRSLSESIVKALSRDRTTRHQSAKELLEQLEVVRISLAIVE